MQLPETETGSSAPYLGVDEYTVSSHVLPLTGTALTQIPGIPVSRGNPSSRVQAAGNDNTPFAQPDRQPLSVPGPDGRDPGTHMN